MLGCLLRGSVLQSRVQGVRVRSLVEDLQILDDQVDLVAEFLHLGIVDAGLLDDDGEDRVRVILRVNEDRFEVGQLDVDLNRIYNFVLGAFAACDGLGWLRLQILSGVNLVATICRCVNFLVDLLLEVDIDLLVSIRLLFSFSLARVLLDELE